MIAYPDSYRRTRVEYPRDYVIRHHIVTASTPSFPKKAGIQEE